MAVPGRLQPGAAWSELDRSGAPGAAAPFAPAAALERAVRTPAGLLRDAGLSPARLEIEIAEPLLLADAEAGGAGLAALDDIGVRIALDDFGSGPMSLRSLELGLLDTIKLVRDASGGAR